jgi:serine/threonine-protein kinase RsbW
MNERADDSKRPISLVIPSKPDYVGLCRLVAGVVGARESLDEEVIADLKLVVSEACTRFLEPEGDSDEPLQATGSSGTLRVDFTISADAWEIILSDPAGVRRLPPLSGYAPLSEEGLSVTIMSALVDTVEQVEQGGGGSQLRLVKKFRPSVSPES